MHRKTKAAGILLIASATLNLMLWAFVIPPSESASTPNAGRGSSGERRKPDLSRHERERHQGRVREQGKAWPVNNRLVEMPWQLVRPYFTITPFDSDGTLTEGFIEALGLSPTEASEISTLCREARAREIDRIVATAQVVEHPGGTRTVRVPAAPDVTTAQLISGIEGLGLPQFSVIKSVIQDNARPEEYIYDKHVSARTNPDGSIVLIEEWTSNERTMGRSEIRYAGRQGMPAEHAALYDRFLME